jgi:hypothetical protein
MAGAAVFVGGVATEEVVTTAVNVEVAAREPAELIAVTASWTVAPRSFEESAYVGPLAPPMSAQFRPDRLQRLHEYPKVIGVSPVHVPRLA